MADVNTLIMKPGEKLSDFNHRIKLSCANLAVTEVQLEIIDGLPMIVLLAETEEATEEDVQDAGKDAGFAVGDLIPTQDPVEVKLVKIKTTTEKDVALAEDRLEKTYALAAGGVVAHIYATGPSQNLTENPSGMVHYIAVSYISDADADEGEDGSESEDKLAKNLRSAPTK